MISGKLPDHKSITKLRAIETVVVTRLKAFLRQTHGNCGKKRRRKNLMSGLRGPVTKLTLKAGPGVH